MGSQTNYNFLSWSRILRRPSIITFKESCPISNCTCFVGAIIPTFCCGSCICIDTKHVGSAIWVTVLDDRFTSNLHSERQHSNEKQTHSSRCRDYIAFKARCYIPKSTNLGTAEIVVLLEASLQYSKFWTRILVIPFLSLSLKSPGNSCTIWLASFVLLYSTVLIRYNTIPNNPSISFLLIWNVSHHLAFRTSDNPLNRHRNASWNALVIVCLSDALNKWFRGSKSTFSSMMWWLDFFATKTSQQFSHFPLTLASTWKLNHCGNLVKVQNGQNRWDVLDLLVCCSFLKSKEFVWRRPLN